MVEEHDSVRALFAYIQNIFKKTLKEFSQLAEFAEALEGRAAVYAYELVYALQRAPFLPRIKNDAQKTNTQDKRGAQKNKQKCFRSGFVFGYKGAVGKNARSDCYSR